MEHALREHQVELPELLGVKVVDAANRERAAAVEPTTRRCDVGSVRINADICDLGEEPQNVSWPTPDVEDAVSSLRTYVRADVFVAYALWAETAFQQLIHNRYGKQGSDTRRSLCHGPPNALQLPTWVGGEPTRPLGGSRKAWHSAWDAGPALNGSHHARLWWYQETVSARPRSKGICGA